MVQKTKVHFDQLSATQLVSLSKPTCTYYLLEPLLIQGPPPLIEAPDNALLPTNSPEDYHLHFLSPNGCERTQCSMYVAIDTNKGNDSYLDIYLEGLAQGWVGVGFGHSQSMVRCFLVYVYVYGKKQYKFVYSRI